MPKIARPFLALISLASLSSCENVQKAPSNYDPYVSNYGNDGGYNPYPGQAGYAQSGGVSPSYDLPPAPVEADPYAFNSTSSKPKTTASSPPKKPTTTTAKAPSKSKAATSGTYTVAKGDTLYGIALKRKSTVAKIKAANSLKSDLIRPGQKLKIP